ncbi:MAG: SDR family oxidoreductase [Treponema sp.]|nr:SDR family oxidoreductase [Treponema sp.]
MEVNFFHGKRALIIGGSGGIGREISKKLSESGADLVLHSGHSGEKLDCLLAEITEKTGKKPDSIVENLLEKPFSSLNDSKILPEAKKCDILCVCFGPFLQKPLHETSLPDWERLALYDYALPGLLTSAALPHMMEKGWGRILLFGGTGTSHRLEYSTNAAYAGAKAGINVLVSSTAAFYADKGITCNAILPGFTRTEYTPASLVSSLSEKMPKKSMIQPSSIAEIALFLLKNADINGEVLRADGGWSPLYSR